MLAFLIENLATILISAVLLAVVILIILKLKKDRQKGCSSCGCGCGGCGSSCAHGSTQGHRGAQDTPQR